MRRSGAPSRLNPAKRFCVPYKTNCETLSTTSKLTTQNLQVREEENNSLDKCEPQDVKSIIPVPDIKEESPCTPRGNISKFRRPMTNINRSNTPVHNTNSSSGDEGASAKSTCSTKKYFSVVWGKLSKKKHKKWEGDAVLVICGRSVTLFDMESKEIGKGAGYKMADLENLKEDETLIVGGKEIQVMSSVTEEQFMSGTCFSGGSPTTRPEQSVVTSVKKAYVDPQKKPSDGILIAKKLNSTFQHESVNFRSSPRHDPSAPGALVMPKPSPSHQWLYNKQKLPVLDVVVDPYLSCHLRPHQREGVVFLYECIMGMQQTCGLGAILADDMGLGKTLQCITVLWTLLKQGPYGGKPMLKRVLVITPGSLVKNWLAEFQKWLGSERLNVFGVCSDNRVEEYVKTAIYPVLVISYEMFVRASEILKATKFDIVVCDEGHRLKNSAIKTTAIIGNLAISRRVVLTGTPIQNDLKEFFSIIEFCNPGILGSSASFRRVFEDPIVASRQPGASQEVVTLGQERGAELTKLTKAFILRRTQDINNKYLPPKVELVLFCKPSNLQLQLYRRTLHSQVIRSCLCGTMDGSPHLVCIGALKQLCNHPGLVWNKAVDAAGNGKESVYSGLRALYPADFCSDVLAVEDSGKLAVLTILLKNIHSSGEKTVLVSNHTKTLDILEKFCIKDGYQFVRLDGQTPTTQRQDIVNKFNNKYSDHSIFLLSTKAGGVGLNLVGASRLILYDIDWNPANDLQAMARVWRDGQKKKVYIYRLLTTGTIEEKIYQRQISKQGLSGAVMDVKEKKDVQFSHDDLKDLFTLNEMTDCDTHSLLNCNCHGNNVDGDTSVSSRTVSRVCQLGGMLADTQKNLSMDELLDWHHLTGQSPDISPAWCISNTEHISFIFWNEVKS
ncbi:DNA repair and recombination protein RAD54B-like [Gigantopelta aegis]|uniref:DNA repair and recombination protein RAD54B-like n=1 Tax=Gigantopelta aegis TaxID=1735272 RepID=UPI001B88C9B6|nr:DNA repair and recombination protein RAD54B-like [Gigantopelta aegis]